MIYVCLNPQNFEFEPCQLKSEQNMDMFLNHGSFSMGSNSPSIQDQILQVTVVAGDMLKDTECFSKQDPYVVVNYGGTQYRTKTCKDGGVNPLFHDKFQFKLIEGLRELSITVFNSNVLTANDFIGHGKVLLKEVFWTGYQECSCLLTNDKKSAGEIRLILVYPNAQKQEAILVPPPSAPAPFQPSLCPTPAFYQTPAPFQTPPCPEPAFYQIPAPYPPCPAYQPPYLPQQPSTYSPYGAPPQPQTPYPPPYSTLSLYPPPPHYAYPPPAPQVYPPPGPSSVYPPPPGPSSHFAPPSPYHGGYPPPYYR